MSRQVIRGIAPSKSNSYQIVTVKGRPMLTKTKRMKEYEESFMWQCNLRDKGIDTPFEFHIDVYYPTKRNDLDGVLKGTMDILESIKAIKNDNLCCKIVAQKFIDKENPRIEFEIITT